MNNCYSLNKVCGQDSGMSVCGGDPDSLAQCPDNMWFWLLAACAGVALVVNHSKGAK
jgi:hypothetical protein